MKDVVILGAGFAGLSASYHIGHDHCVVLEAQARPYGHAKSWNVRGFTWDEGPHVSFTKHRYVRDLFARSTGGELDEYEVRVGNYYRGAWIDHPAQSNLYQVPEPLRSEVLEGFRNRRAVNGEPTNYAEWLELSFGEPFARTFPSAYTRKYWTTDPATMATDWVGSRMYQPSAEEVARGATGPLPKATHYITTVRYPRRGGYESFARLMATDADVRLEHEVVAVDLVARTIRCANGATFEYKRLINTLPLPAFIACCAQRTDDIMREVTSLSCSQLVLVNVEVPHEARRPENWFYVYDEDKYSTRISFTEKLTQRNAPAGQCGIQVEVYGSRHRPFDKSPEQIGICVIRELVEMGLIDAAAVSRTIHTTAFVPWANVIFTRETRAALDRVLRWLEPFGLEREADDLHPTTDWSAVKPVSGRICLAGRFGQWKYAWSDDCVMRGRQLAGIVG